MSGHWSEAPSCHECYDDKRNHVRVCAFTEVGYCPNDKRFTEAELVTVWRSIAQDERAAAAEWQRVAFWGGPTLDGFKKAGPAPTEP